jgi:hypothetical protein
MLYVTVRPKRPYTCLPLTHSNTKLYGIEVPTASIAHRPAVERALSESFAVVADRKHTVAMRNDAKFRGVFLIFGCETLFSRQTFATIRQTFGSMVRFWAVTDRMMAQIWYQMALRQLLRSVP